jgi:DNA polymerase I-like protein with 3'-5' exonuclease and polymerase domains/uracil-DNA glycosylase
MLDPNLLPEGYSKHRVRGRGPIPCDVLIVGEAPGADEDRHGRPFVGLSGQELDKMLSEAGFIVSSIHYTNVIKYKAPDIYVKGKRIANAVEETAFIQTKTEAKRVGASEFYGRYPKPFVYQCIQELKDEIEAIQPKIIIALGNIALWACTGNNSISLHHGSVVRNTFTASGYPKVIATFDPAHVLKVWGERYKVVQDLRRARHELKFPEIRDPGYQFTIRPSFEQAVETLDTLASGKLSKIVANDIETKSYQISCTGFAWSATEAICIPFFGATGEPYWQTAEEEVAIVQAVQRVLLSPNIELVGQHYAYDAQYNFRRLLAFTPLKHDTLLAEHILNPGEDKDLAYLSTKYCEHHRFWKEDSKIWDPALTSEESHWIYNCTDCVKTWEIIGRQLTLIEKFKLQEQYSFILRMWKCFLWMMLKGIRVDLPLREKLLNPETSDLIKAIAERDSFIAFVGEGLNIASPKQMKEFFYDELGMTVVKHKKTKKPTCDGDALLEFKREQPILTPLVDAIDENRSLRTFYKNFAQAALDSDWRMRCYYNVGGQETYRVSSAESAFDTGTNLQNIPKGDRSRTMAMPNMRRLLVPDPGFLICEIDLAGADAQVVAWEADDGALKEAFRRGFKIHAVNAKDLFGGNAGPDGRKEPWYTYAKVGVHLTNYRGKPGTLAKSLGITRHEADKFQKRWFSIHPGIVKWHERIDHSVQSTRCIYNKFGFRKVYYDRIENVLTNATAWGPQSTVAIVINKAISKGFTLKQPVDFLLQVHDSTVFQLPIEGHLEILRDIHQSLLTPVPYPDPLTIQFGLAVSEKSWGDVEKMDWPA